MAKDDLSKQLSQFMSNYRKVMDNYRKAEASAQKFKEAQKSLGVIMADGDPAATINYDYNSSPRSMNNRVNTIIGAIRDNALTKEGMRGLAGDYRFNQIKDALNPNAGNVKEMTTTIELPDGIGNTLYPDGSRSRSVGMDANGTVYFKYMAGDTLGDVIKELGLQTDKGLWGPDGDVEYYTKQLREQGINGNIPTDRVIKLQKRK